MRFSSRRIHSVTLLRVSFARCFWVKIFRWMDGNLINFCRKTGPCATVVRVVSPQQLRLLPDACLTPPELHFDLQFCSRFLQTEFL